MALVNSALAVGSNASSDDAIDAVVGEIIESLVKTVEGELENVLSTSLIDDHDVPATADKDVQKAECKKKEHVVAKHKYLIVNLSSEHKAELLKLLSVVFPKFPSSGTFDQLKEAMPEYYRELSHLVNYFNTSLSVKKIWVDMHLIKPPASYWNLQSEGSLTLIHFYLKYWLTQFYTCSDFIRTFKEGNVEHVGLITAMILNIFKSLELTFPQFHVLFLERWVSLRELEYRFEPYLRYDQLLKLSQHRLSAEMLEHVDIDTKFEHIIFLLEKRNTELDEANKTIELLQKENKEKCDELRQLQLARIQSAQVVAPQPPPVAITPVRARCLLHQHQEESQARPDHMDDVFASVLKQTNTKPPTKIDSDVAAAGLQASKPKSKKKAFRLSTKKKYTKPLQQQQQPQQPPPPPSQPGEASKAPATRKRKLQTEANDKQKTVQVKVEMEEDSQIVEISPEPKRARTTTTQPQPRTSTTSVPESEDSSKSSSDDIDLFGNSETVNPVEAEKYAKVIKGKHVCCICQQECLTLKGFRQHIKCHGGMVIFSCPQDGCAKFFKTHYKLKRHYLTHAMERPFACSDCDRTYKRADKLSEHRRQYNHFGEGSSSGTNRSSTTSSSSAAAGSSSGTNRASTTSSASSSCSTSPVGINNNNTAKAYHATRASTISIKEEIDTQSTPPSIPVKKSLRIQMRNKKAEGQRPE